MIPSSTNVIVDLLSVKRSFTDAILCSVVLGYTSSIVLSVLGGKDTPGMFDPVF